MTQQHMNVASLPVPTTRTMPSLETEIAKRREELERLLKLQQQQNELTGQIVMVLTGQPTSNVVVDQMRTVDARAQEAAKPQNGKKIGEILFNHMVKELKTNKDYRITARQASNIVEEAGYVSESANFYNVVRQCLVTDKRFNKRGKKGKNGGVTFGLAV